MAYIGDLVVRITASTSQLERAVGKSQGLLNSLVSRAQRAVGSVNGILGTIGASASIGGIIKLAADAETLAMQFRVLTKSAESAATIMKELEQFAASTPFEKLELGDAVRKLLAFGSSASGVFQELRTLGDIASGTGVPIGEMAELYGKARVQGRLFAQDINQLTGRGIPIIQALAKHFKVADSDIRGMVEAGKVGFAELSAALQSMTAEGGQFNGMMIELSTTTAGRFSTLVDGFKAIGVTIGTEILPYLNVAMDVVTEMTSGWQNAGDILKLTFLNWAIAAVDGAEQVYAAIAGVFGIVKSLGTSLVSSWETFFNGINAGFDALLSGNNPLEAFRESAKVAFAGEDPLGFSSAFNESRKAALKSMEGGTSAGNMLRKSRDVLLESIGEKRTAAAEAAAANIANAVGPAVAKAIEKIPTPVIWDELMGGKLQKDKGTPGGLAGGLQRGSAEAYSALVNAGKSDPTTKAVEAQTRVLLNDVAKPLKKWSDAAPIAVMESFIA